jgi:hypothetical protein
MLSTMRCRTRLRSILGMSIIVTAAYSATALGASLIDENGQVREEHKFRCPDSKNLSPDSCARNRDLARQSGCISVHEHQVAASLGIMVICDPATPTEIFTACPCSCFSRGTRIMTWDSTRGSTWTPAGELGQGHRPLSLTNEAQLQSLAFQPRNLVYTTQGPEEPDLYVIHTEGNRSLAVTQHHALLLESGRMVTAQNLREGDRLVDTEGRGVTVAQITREHSSDDVVNFLVESDSHNGHLVVAEGLIVGDLIWQNMLDSEFVEVSLR